MSSAFEVVQRLLDNLRQFVDNSADPGAEALGALWEGEQFLQFLATSTEGDDDTNRLGRSDSEALRDAASRLRAFVAASTHQDSVLSIELGLEADRLAAWAEDDRGAHPTRLVAASTARALLREVVT